MRGLMMIDQPNLPTVLDNNNSNNQENMSNVTSAASGEASVSSSNGGGGGGGGVYPSHHNLFAINAMAAAAQPQSQQIKKKRNQPGNPDPDAEVIALSPKSLLATNRFVCEICQKGFQRDQNLQLHRRGHNLPWKLKQRSSKDIARKKVYVCPEAGCVHHDPSRALGDLTGIKKHFSRKHGEKKWKCPKCSKRYAVQSDWKAHSKTCGTREYRCDCGTLFSRRDSFITHRAFCEALAEESGSRAIFGNSLHHPFQPPEFSINQNLSVAVKKEHTGLNLRPEIPPWLMSCPQLPVDMIPSFFQDFPNSNAVGHALPDFEYATPAAVDVVRAPHFSATALLQKASQMGASMTSPSVGPSLVESGAHGAPVSADQPLRYHSLAADHFGLNLSSRVVANGLASSGGKVSVCAGAPSANGAPAGSLFYNIFNNSFPSPNTNPTYEDPMAFPGGGAGVEFLMNSNISKKHGDDEVTKDFLGLRPLSGSDIFSITDLVNSTSSNHRHAQSQKTWQQAYK